MSDSEHCEVWTNAILEDFSKNLQELLELLEKCNTNLINVKNKFGCKCDEPEYNISINTEYDNVLNTVENDVHNGTFDPAKTSIGYLMISLIQNEDNLYKML